MARLKSPPLTFFYQTAVLANTSRYLAAAKLYGTSTGEQNTRDMYSLSGTQTSFSTSEAATSPSPARPPQHAAPRGRSGHPVCFPPCLRPSAAAGPTTRRSPARGVPPSRTCISLPLSSGAVAEPAASWRQPDPAGVCGPRRRRAEGEAAVPSRRCPAAAIARRRCYGKGPCRRRRRPLPTPEDRSSAMGGLGAAIAVCRSRFPGCAAVVVELRQQRRCSGAPRRACRGSSFVHSS